jgi:four helix bundle protein
MGTIRRFEDLQVWAKSRELTRLVYKVTSHPSFTNDLRLRNQMRDAAVSIMSNIAEGFSRNTDKEFIQFLFVSKASVAEIQSQSYVALDQQYLSNDIFVQIYEMADHTSRMLSNLIKYLRTSVKSTRRNDAVDASTR